MASETSSPPYAILLSGQEVTAGHMLSFVIERDMFQPDMAAIVLTNQDNEYSSKYNCGDAIEVKVGDDMTSIYKGEIVGIEPTFKGGEKQRILIRGMNKLHRLLRKRKSKTYSDQSDKDIINSIVGEAGLSLKFGKGPTIVHKHVYQHNQNDLEFIRMRAARMNFHVWCVGSELFVGEPDLESSPIATLEITEPGGKAGEGTIKSFTPRLSNANVVKKLTVKGWDPEKKQLIVGDAEAGASPLGSTGGASSLSDFGNIETFTVDHPIWSVEEAKQLAKARLVDLNLTYITGECELTGDARMDLGKVVKIVSNSVQANDRFNGKYYIMGVTHRYMLSKTKDGGFTTILRLARDAEKGS